MVVDLSLLSICVPTYNRAASLARVIDHVYGLDLDFSFEVLVVDNCSDDGTQDVIKLHEHRENFRHYRQNKNIGSGPNGIASLRLAKGEYCMILCDDDDTVAGSLFPSVDTLVGMRSCVCIIFSFSFCKI